MTRVFYDVQGHSEEKCKLKFVPVIYLSYEKHGKFFLATRNAYLPRVYRYSKSKVFFKANSRSLEEKV